MRPGAGCGADAEGDRRTDAARGRRDVAAQSALPFFYFAGHQFEPELLQKFE
jgi:hypothetical protein